MIQKQVGLRIKEIRHAKKLSQEECSFNVELDRTYWSSVERGLRNISINNLHKICLSFGISLKDFLIPIFLKMMENKERINYD